MVSTSQATGTCDARSFAFAGEVPSLLDVHFKLSIVTCKTKRKSQKGVETRLEQVRVNWQLLSGIAATPEGVCLSDV